MDLRQRKRRGKSYVEHFVAFNKVDDGPRYYVIARQKIEGIPPSWEVVFASEDKEKAEQEAARLNSLLG